MTHFEVLYVVWNCLGLQGNLVPYSVRPLAAAIRVGNCYAVPQIERHSNREVAERRVYELGPQTYARLRWCQRMKCWDRKLLWEPSLKIE